MRVVTVGATEVREEVRGCVAEEEVTAERWGKVEDVGGAAATAA